MFDVTSLRGLTGVHSSSQSPTSKKKKAKETCAFLKIFLSRNLKKNLSISPLHFLDQKMLAELHIFSRFFGAFSGLENFGMSAVIPPLWSHALPVS